ncbi:MAG: hypothetical protein NTW16_16425 [Bacteroidetes bacterium]|nr:hypothetical protein [Bacteroidota bacterium]
MKKLSAILVAVILAMSVFAQSPRKFSYQAVVRNAAGKLVQNSNVGLRISILQGSASGTVVYTETHQAVTNVNGLVSVEIGGGSTTGSFSDINWTNGPCFMKSETDPAGGTNYSVTGVSQLLSVPYALHAESIGNGFTGDYNDLTNKPVTDGSETKMQAGNKISISGSGSEIAPYIVNSTAVEFSGNYNDLTNKPVTDGSETKLQAGTRISVTGTGTATAPYIINSTNSGYPAYNKTTITTSQTWTVPAAVTKIKVELWGGAGGGGGAGAYSYSYNLNNGGDGGTGGYAKQEITVAPNQQFSIVIGAGGSGGYNAYYSNPGYYGDTDGGNGGDSWFGQIKAAGGTGGKRGGYSTTTVHGNAGTANSGTVTGYSDNPQNNILNVFTGLERSYLNDRILTSKSGKGGILSGYSGIIPTGGEGGAAVITLFE